MTNSNLGELDEFANQFGKPVDQDDEFVSQFGSLADDSFVAQFARQQNQYDYFKKLGVEERKIGDYLSNVESTAQELAQVDESLATTTSHEERMALMDQRRALRAKSVGTEVNLAAQISRMEKARTELQDYYAKLTRPEPEERTEAQPSKAQAVELSAIVGYDPNREYRTLEFDEPMTVDESGNLVQKVRANVTEASKMITPGSFATPIADVVRPFEAIIARPQGEGYIVDNPANFSAVKATVGDKPVYVRKDPEMEQWRTQLDNETKAGRVNGEVAVELRGKISERLSNPKPFEPEENQALPLIAEMRDKLNAQQQRVVDAVRGGFIEPRDVESYLNTGEAQELSAEIIKMAIQQRNDYVTGATNLSNKDIIDTFKAAGLDTRPIPSFEEFYQPEAPEGTSLAAENQVNLDRLEALQVYADEYGGNANFNPVDVVRASMESIIHTNAYDAIREAAKRSGAFRDYLPPNLTPEEQEQRLDEFMAREREGVSFILDKISNAAFTALITLTDIPTSLMMTGGMIQSSFQGKSADETALYQTGKMIQDGLREGWLDPTITGITEEIVGGATSIVAYMAAGGIIRGMLYQAAKVAPFLTSSKMATATSTLLTTSALTATPQTIASIYNDARALGVSDDDAKIAAYIMGPVAGTVQLLNVTRLLGQIERGVRPGVKRAFAMALESGINEAIVESTGTYLSDGTVKNIYTKFWDGLPDEEKGNYLPPDQVTSEWLKAGQMGGGLGFAFGLLSYAIGSKGVSARRNSLSQQNARLKEAASTSKEELNRLAGILFTDSPQAGVLVSPEGGSQLSPEGEQRKAKASNPSAVAQELGAKPVAAEDVTKAEAEVKKLENELEAIDEGDDLLQGEKLAELAKARADLTNLYRQGVANLQLENMVDQLQGIPFEQRNLAIAAIKVANGQELSSVDKALLKLNPDGTINPDSLLTKDGNLKQEFVDSLNEISPMLAPYVGYQEIVVRASRQMGEINRRRLEANELRAKAEAESIPKTADALNAQADAIDAYANTLLQEYMGFLGQIPEGMRQQFDALLVKQMSEMSPEEIAALSTARQVEEALIEEDVETPLEGEVGDAIETEAAVQAEATQAVEQAVQQAVAEEAGQPAPQVTYASLTARGRIGSRILRNAGIDEATANRVAATLDEQLDSSMNTEDFRQAVIDEFRMAGGIIPGQSVYSEDIDFYKRAFEVTDAEAAQMVEDAKQANAAADARASEINQAWDYANRQEPQQAESKDKSVTILNYEEKIKPIQDRMDAKIDELVNSGKTFQEAIDSKEVMDILEERLVIDRGAINNYRDIVSEAFVSQGITRDDLAFTPLFKIIEDIYAVPRTGDEGMIAIVSERGQEAFNDDAKTIRKLSELIFKHSAEAEGLSPEGLLGPESNLTDSGKRDRVDSAKRSATEIHRKIKERLLEQVEQKSTQLTELQLDTGRPPVFQGGTDIITPRRVALAQQSQVEQVAPTEQAAVSSETQQALAAVANNTATPEQVEALVGQRLVAVVDGQNVITNRGIAAMEEGTRPPLTEEERRRQIELPARYLMSNRAQIRQRVVRAGVPDADADVVTDQAIVKALKGARTASEAGKFLNAAKRGALATAIADYKRATEGTKKRTVDVVDRETGELKMKAAVVTSLDAPVAEGMTGEDVYEGTKDDDALDANDIISNSLKTSSPAPLLNKTELEKSMAEVNAKARKLKSSAKAMETDFVASLSEAGKLAHQFNLIRYDRSKATEARELLSQLEREIDNEGIESDPGTYARELAREFIEYVQGREGSDVRTSTIQTDGPGDGGRTGSEAGAVTPIARDATKPEQMTPEEYKKKTPISPANAHGSFKTKKAASADLIEKVNKMEKAPSSSFRDIVKSYGLNIGDLYEVVKSNYPNGDYVWVISGTHKNQIAASMQRLMPVSAVAVDAYGITLPEGYQKQGELYVYQPASIAEQAAALDEQTPTPKIKDEIANLRRQQRKQSGHTTLLIDIPDAVVQFGKSIYKQGMTFSDWGMRMLRRFGEDVRSMLSALWQSLNGGHLLPHARERGAVGTGVAITPEDARHAELERLAKAGDKQAEAEAQRMADEAARAAGSHPNQSNDLEKWLFALGKIDGVNQKARFHNRLILDGKEPRGTFAYAAINRPPSQISIGNGRAYDDAGILVTDIALPFDKQMSLQTFPVGDAELAETAKLIFAKGLILENNGSTYAITPSTTSSSLRVTSIDKEGPTGHIHLDNGWFASDLRTFLIGARVFDERNPNQIKSAAPFTYDDSGNLIPLSQRFTPDSPDIRYSRTAKPVATPQETARFNELTADLQAKGELTQADIDAWREAKPEAYAELEKMREDVLKRAGHGVKAYHGGVDVTEFNVFPMFLSPYENVAQSYADDRAAGGVKAKLHSVFIKAENPANGEQVLNAAKTQGIEGMVGKDSPPHEFLSPGMVGAEEAERVALQLKDEGFDSAHTDGDFSMDYDFVEYDSWTIFDPEQIKSADPLNLEYGKLIPPDQWADSGSPDIRYSLTQERAFYSQLQNVLERKMPNAASPQQVRGIVDPGKGSGVKAEELKWSGFEQAIDRIASENNGKVPKDALLEYLRNEGAVRFEEVTLGGKMGQRYNQQLRKRADDLTRELRILREDTTNIYGDDKRKWPKEVVAPIEKLKSELRQAIADRDNDAETKEALFEKYQLPGGENYREVVLAMPQDESMLLKEGYEVRQLNDGSWRVLSPGGTASFGESKEQAVQRAGAARENKSAYTSTHFPDVPNYVAHMRMNERDGGLFIEEIQSDRHQAGREKGYRSGGDQKAQEQAAYNQLVEEGVPMFEAQRRVQEQFGSGEIPDAPFRTTWPLALFKRALRDAVESGKEWIGWTVGETQNERYDLSKQVEFINVEHVQEAEGVFFVDIATKGDRGRNDVINLEVENGVVREGEFSGKPLSDVIGKDMAEKIVSVPKGESKVLKGEALKVGGEGMKGFYDQILPKEIAKYVKQWGAKVEMSEVATEMKADDIDPYDLSDATPEELAELQTTGAVQGGMRPIWRIDITPEMRKSIQTIGQPLFSRQSQTQGIGLEATQARLTELGYAADGMVVAVNEPGASWDGRTILRDGKVIRIEINAATVTNVEAVVAHELAEAANADGALDQLISNLSQTERDTIQSDITRLGYAESVRDREAAARATERLVKTWRGRNWFERAVGRVLAWANKAGLPMTRLAAEAIAARAVAKIDSNVRAETAQDVKAVDGNEVRESRTGETTQEPSDTPIKHKLTLPEKGTYDAKIFTAFRPAINVVQQASNKRRGDRPAVSVAQMISDAIMMDVSQPDLAKALREEAYFTPKQAEKIATIFTGARDELRRVDSLKKTIRANMQKGVNNLTPKAKKEREIDIRIAEIAGTMDRVVDIINQLGMKQFTKDRSAIFKARLKEAKNAVRKMPKEMQSDLIVKLAASANSEAQLLQLADEVKRVVNVHRLNRAEKKAKERLNAAKNAYKKLSEKNRELINAYLNNYTVNNFTPRVAQRLSNVLDVMGDSEADLWVEFREIEPSVKALKEQIKPKIKALREKRAEASKISDVAKRKSAVDSIDKEISDLEIATFGLSANLPKDVRLASDLDKVALAKIKEQENGLEILNGISESITEILAADRREKGVAKHSRYQNTQEAIDAFLGESEALPGLTRRKSNGELDLPAPWKLMFDTLLPQSIMRMTGSETLYDRLYESILRYGYRDQLETEQAWKKELTDFLEEKSGRVVGTKDFESWSNQTFKVIGYTQDGKKGTMDLTRRELWDLYASLKDPDNLKQASRRGYVIDSRRLMDFQQWKMTGESLAQLDAIMEKGEKDENTGMTADQEIAEFIHYFYQQYRAKLFPVLETVNGFAPVANDNYYPRTADADTRTGPSDPMAEFEQFYRESLEGVGFLKDRDESSTSLMVVQDSLERSIFHLQNSARIAAYLPYIHDAKSFLDDPKVKRRIKEKLGESGYQNIYKSVMVQAIPVRRDVTNAKGLDAAWDFIVRNSAIPFIGLKATATLINPAGIPIGLSFLGRKAGAYARTADYLPSNLSKLNQILTENSPYYRERYGKGGFLQEYTGGIVRKGKMKFRKATNDWAMSPIEFTDRGGGLVRAAILEQYVNDVYPDLTKGTEAYNEQLAWEWEKMMFRSENSSHGLDRTTLLQAAAQNRFWATFVAFTSSASKIWSAQVESMAFADMATRMAKGTDRSKVVAHAKNLMIGAVASALYGAVVRDFVRWALGWDDEEEKTLSDVAKRYGVTVLGSQMLGTAPVLGNFLSAGLNRIVTGDKGSPYSMSTVESLATSSFKTAMGIVDAADSLWNNKLTPEGEQKWIDDILKAMSYSAEPVGLVTRTPLPALRQYWKAVYGNVVDQAGKHREDTGNLSNAEANRNANKLLKEKQGEPLTDEYARIARGLRLENYRDFKDGLSSLKEKRPNISYKDLQARVRSQFAALNSIESGRLTAAQVGLNADALASLRLERRIQLDQLDVFWQKYRNEQKE